MNNFKRLNQEYIHRNLQLIRVWGMFYPLLGTMLGLGGVFVLWIGGRQVIAGRITLGDFVAFNAYLGMLSWPMIALGWVINIVERGTASLERINRIFEAQPEIWDDSVRIVAPCYGSDALQPEERYFIRRQCSRRNVQFILASERKSSSGSSAPRNSFSDSEIQGEIEFRALSFAYNGQPVLKDISLFIPRGATFAIVGETGSGKSTLVNLLARVHDYTRGRYLD